MGKLVRVDDEKWIDVDTIRLVVLDDDVVLNQEEDGTYNYGFGVSVTADICGEEMDYEVEGLKSVDRGDVVHMMDKFAIAINDIKERCK